MFEDQYKPICICRNRCYLPARGKAGEFRDPGSEASLDKLVQTIKYSMTEEDGSPRPS